MGISRTASAASLVSTTLSSWTASVASTAFGSSNSPSAVSSTGPQASPTSLAPVAQRIPLPVGTTIGTGLTMSGNVVTVNTAGTYEILSDLFFTGNGPFSYGGQLVVNGVVVAAPTSPNTLSVDGPIYYTATLAAGSTIEWRGVSNSPSGSSIQVTAAAFIVRQALTSTASTANLTATTLSRLHGTLNTSYTSNLTAGDHVKFETTAFTQGGGIVLDTTSAYSSANAANSVGRITITGAGKTIRLTGCVWINMSNNSVTEYGWYNADTGVALPGNLGSQTVVTHPNAWNSNGTAVATFTTTAATTRVELRITNAGGGLNGINAAAFGSGSSTYFTVEELPTASVNSFIAGNTFIQEWQTYVPTITGSVTNPTLPTTRTLRASYRVVGKSLHLKFQLTATSMAGAAPGNGYYSVALPAGFTINTTAAPATTNLGFAGNSGGGADGMPLGFGRTSVVNTGATRFEALATVVPVSATAVGLYLGNQTVLTASTGTGNGLWGSGLGNMDAGTLQSVVYHFNAEIPIL